MTDVLLITPPFTQLNTPYPATAYLKGFLNTKEIPASQADLGIDVILQLFSKNELEKIFHTNCYIDAIETYNSQRIFSLKNQYLKTIDPVISFLQGKSPTLARQICSSQFLPQASRFEQLEELEWAFGNMGLQDKAKHLCTLYLEDLSDFIKECVDPNFGFSRYAESIGQSANLFDELYQKLHQKLSYIDQLTTTVLEKKLQNTQPKLLSISVPFPGNLLGAFRCAQYVKTNHPEIKINLGGGFANTELRDLKDIRVFEFVDYISLDDGELPIELILSNIKNPTSDNPDFNKLKRTLVVKEGQVHYNNESRKLDYKQTQVGTPDYSDLPLDDYISVIEIMNPMHSLWSDGRWNKLTMAHGCYWGKCSFCDISLDYIKIYEPVAAKLIVDRMETLVNQTGENGFHFVDEAAPPALMREVAIEILKRGLIVTWWTNIRFEKSFTRDLCKLLKASGCIAVSGGLEVASDRLLKLIEKGVSLAQVANVTKAFTDAGIMVHAYLMYGFPSQTEQETIDSLEMVRQLFEMNCMQSGFWHQFSLTTHSPIGKDPEKYGIVPNYKDIQFANNDVLFTDKTNIDHSKFSQGLKASIYNYMHGIGFDIPLEEWFDFSIPPTTVAPNYIYNCLEERIPNFKLKKNAQVIWLGTPPLVEVFSKTKKGNTWQMLRLQFETATESFDLTLSLDQGEWLYEMLEKISIENGNSKITLGDLKQSYDAAFGDFELFWFSKQLTELKAFGLVSV